MTTQRPSMTPGSTSTPGHPAAPWRDTLRAYALLGRMMLRPVTTETWAVIDEAIRLRFPDVRGLSTGALAGWLEDPGRRPPVILDVRPADEYAVSHLPGAVAVRNVADVRSRLPDRATPLVVYCAAGYRSAAFARRLQRAGYSAVANLNGSIFAWANESRPLYRDGQLLPGPEVHPYQRKWAGLLSPGVRVRLGG